MNRAIVFALLALAGCAQGEPIEGVDLIAPIAGESGGETDLELAADVWGLPMPAGWVEIDAPESDVTVVCEFTSGHAEGCTVGAARQVWVAVELSPELRQVVLLHELGHVLSGRSDHVTEGCGRTHATSSHLMCAHAALTLPTSEDYDYLAEGQQ